MQSRWTYEETIADGANGAVIEISSKESAANISLKNQATGKITCTLIAGANIGKFQTTTSSSAKIKADTAVWIDWPEGDATGTIADVITGPVTGVRGVSVSGEIGIEIAF